MDLDTEILNLLSRLGHRETDGEVEVFVPEANPVKTLKAIRRLLNRDAKDDEDFGLESLSQVRAVRNNFIPLLLASFGQEHGEEVVDEVVKLLVCLTLPGSKWAEAHANELRVTLAEEAKANRSPLALIVSRVEGALETDASRRSEDDRKRMDLLLFLVRNLLVPSPNEIGKEELVAELERESIFDIVLHFTNHVGRKNNREWDLLLLEIYFYLFRTVTPDDLAAVQIGQDNNVGQNVDCKVGHKGCLQTELGSTMQELRHRKQSTMRAMPTRHSHFGGLLVVGNDQTRKLVSSIFKINDPRRFAEAALPSSIAQRKRRAQDTSVVSNDILSTNQRNTVPNVLKCIRKVSDELLESGYDQLFGSIIQDFRREDARIKPEDEVRFLWMIRFFTRLDRLRKGSGKASIMKTMDLWSFQFVVNRIIDYSEQKSWASLETAVGALFEMMSNLKEVKAKDEGKSLKNAVYYELRERLEIVPRLLKLWDPSCSTLSYLRNLVMLGDLILDTLEDMAEEGALAKARSKEAKKAERKAKNAGIFNLSWGAEETHALAEGVKARRGEYDLNIMRSILKDAALGPIFEDQKRTPQQLMARWIQVRAALAGGKTLEQFVREDLAREDGEEKEDEAAAAAEEPIEKQVDFFAGLRSYLSNNVYRNLSRLIDPACHSDGERAFCRDTESHRLVTKFFRRLRCFNKGLRSGESLEPMLWHVEVFECWKRALEAFSGYQFDKLPAESQELSKVLRSSLRRFFRHMQKNPLLTCEILFWRTKQDNVLLSRLHNPKVDRHQASPVDAFLHEDELEDAVASEDEASDADDEYPSDNEDSRINPDDEEEMNLNTRPVINSTSAGTAPVPRISMAPKIAKPDPKERERERLKKSKPAKQPKSNPFKLDVSKLRRLVTLALNAGVSAEAFHCLLRFLEAPTGIGLIDAPFVPIGLDSADSSLDKEEMWRVMLCVGLRPPNRSLETKSRLSVSCEVYWRAPTASSTASDWVIRADALRDAILQDESLIGHTAGTESSALEDVLWCVSDDEEVKGKNALVVESSSDEESSESESEDDANSSPESRSPQRGSKAPQPRPSKSKVRRIVVSSDDEEGDAAEKRITAPVPTATSPLQNSKAMPGASQKRRRVVDSDDED